MYLGSPILIFIYLLYLIQINTAAVPAHPPVHYPSTALTPHSTHTNNWAIIVSTSRYWFNYRHVANALSIYHIVKQLGIPDSHIILMIPDSYACNIRNIYKSHIYNSHQPTRTDLHSSMNIQVDYSGYSVSVESLLRVLSNKHTSNTLRSKRLLSDSNSNILLYLTGHGGNEFLKFQDQTEISSYDIGDTIYSMYISERYNKLLLMADTCQASTLHNQLYSNNTMSIGSSRINENSYSYWYDELLGLSVIDRFTAATLDYIQQYNINTIINHTFSELFHTYDPVQLHSQPEYRNDMFNQPLNTTLLTDFFASRSMIHTNNHKYMVVPDNYSINDDIQYHVAIQHADQLLVKQWYNESSSNQHIISNVQYILDWFDHTITDPSRLYIVPPLIFIISLTIDIFIVPSNHRVVV